MQFLSAEICCCWDCEAKLCKYTVDAFASPAGLRSPSSCERISFRYCRKRFLGYSKTTPQGHAFQFTTSVGRVIGNLSCMQCELSNLHRFLFFPLPFQGNLFRIIAVWCAPSNISTLPCIKVSSMICSDTYC